MGIDSIGKSPGKSLICSGDFDYLLLLFVETDTRGVIIVDEYLKTTQPNIRAVGDVKGGLQFTYISLDDYRIIREDLFGNGIS